MHARKIGLETLKDRALPSVTLVDVPPPEWSEVSELGDVEVIYAEEALMYQTGVVEDDAQLYYTMVPDGEWGGEEMFVYGELPPEAAYRGGMEEADPALYDFGYDPRIVYMAGPGVTPEEMAYTCGKPFVAPAEPEELHTEFVAPPADEAQPAPVQAPVAQMGDAVVVTVDGVSGYRGEEAEPEADAPEAAEAAELPAYAVDLSI